MKNSLMLLILTAVVLAVLLPASNARADVWADGDSVYIHLRAYQKTYSCTSEQLFTYYLAFDPESGDSCIVPTDSVLDVFKDVTNVHLMIMSADSSCAYFNCRVASYYYLPDVERTDLILALPTNEILTENNFVFADGSDYDVVFMDYFRVNNFRLESNQTYTIRLSIQLHGCPSLTFANFETVLGLYSVTIPCCGAYTGGIKGNTNCDEAGVIDSLDVNRLIDRVYLSHTPLCCEANGDVNSDGHMDLTDITYLISYIHLGGDEPDECEY